MTVDVIDVAGYQRYFHAAGYPERYPDYYPWNIHEKSLEHFLCSALIGITERDVYIDIASERSPVPEIYQRLFGADTYSQDLSYPSGLCGKTIGSDAADMPIGEAFATRLGLHCSFEHFEGDADSRFVREAARVLRPGGAACVVPFYLAEEYSVWTDPIVSVPEGVAFEPDALVCCLKGWNNRHGRHYDAGHMAARIIRNLGSLKATVYHVLNAREVHPSCYARFALVLERPGAIG